ncbi:MULTISPECIES: hypothetical protein [unclassified Streptomyces]|uniref:Uncharacterized protein n=1 Tax=Streptomyces sp. NBC_00180 TaxID=2903632 RepID=A0AAU1IB58_9ACTN|nr:hypothetical protein OG331_03815 [Streptomyces sp. NBC_01017]WSV34822.1 hypothetical protein OG331_48165 [Streptomyces sp. NBC_01017]
MPRSKRHHVIALAAATVFLSGLSAPAAFADTSPPQAPVTSAAADLQLDNVRWTPMSTISGSTTWLLRLDSDPGVEPGGRYFLWNPDTSEHAGKFAVGDDVQVSTVGTWQAAMFRPDYTAHRIEVRYGDPSTPEAGRVVATVTHI